MSVYSPVQVGTNDNRYMYKLVILHAQTYSQICINILQMPYLLFTPYHIM